MRFNDEYGFDEDFSIWKYGNKDLAINTQPGHKGGFKTRVLIYDKDDNLVYEGRNKTMLAGSEMVAMRLFNLPTSANGFTTPSYNNELGLENTTLNTGNEQSLSYKINLFCMGKDGCNRESAIWYPVSNKKWIDKNNIVPFQYLDSAVDLKANDRNIYFGRKVISGKIAYYFKKFENSEAAIEKKFDDGVAWSNSIYTDTSERIAQVVVTNTLMITKTDGRDYFNSTSGINDGRFNCIELCASWEGSASGYKVYQGIRPVTRINFPNKYLNEPDASWRIVYTIYF